MINDMEPIVLRTLCGSHRYILIPPGLSDWRMALMPYKKNAGIGYYTQNAVPEDMPKHRTFKDIGLPVEWGPYAETCRVFMEVADEPIVEVPV